MTDTLQTEVGAITRLLLKHARDAFLDERHLEEQWRPLNYEGKPDLESAIAEYDAMVAFLSDFNIDIHFLPAVPNTGLDSIYVRDAMVVSDRGAILCKMGKGARCDEPAVQAELFRELGVPILGSITGEGSVEGGDVVWLDERTIAVGRGYRTNDEGIHQLRDLLGDAVDEFIVVPLPHWKGPSDVFHLMSIISPIDVDLMLVYSPLMPVPFRELLVHRGIELVDVPDSEFPTMGCNVLTVAPRVCLMLGGNPETKEHLQKAGATVKEFDGSEICAKGAGGPTCLTRPLARTKPGRS